MSTERERRRGPPWPTPPDGTYAVSDMKTWRAAICGDRGPSEPTTRHVLLTMSTFADFDGTNLYPGVLWIARRARLSKNTAAKHRELAVKLGFLIPPRTGRHAAGRQIWIPAIPPASLQPQPRKGLRRAKNLKRNKRAVSQPSGHHNGCSVPTGEQDFPNHWDIPASTSGFSDEALLVADSEFGF